MKKKSRKNKSIIFRLLILGVCIYMIATLSSELRLLNKTQKELEQLKAQQLAAETEVEEFKALLKEDSHNKLIEKAARERLGFVYPDEQVFKDISGN